MNRSQADLERQHAEVLERMKALFEANEDLWRVPPGARRDLEQIARNYDELVRLEQLEKSIVQQLLELEKQP
jgi:hypothetical protein